MRARARLNRHCQTSGRAFWRGVVRETLSRVNFIVTMLSLYFWVACGFGVTALTGQAPPNLSQIGDFDPYAQPNAYPQTAALPQSSDAQWCFDLLPDGLIYRPYLAGPKESRTGLQLLRANNEWTLDSSIGGQWGLIRIGTQDPIFPEGFQFDIEASAQLRHVSLHSLDLLSSDFRVGLPLSYGRNNHQTKLAVYFLRAHPSDRLLERIRSLWTDDFFQRQSLVFGHSVYVSNRFRLYGEAGYAFSSKVSDKWEFQFGAECAPVCPTGLLGSPFLAANGYLREEVDFGGTFTLQAGWAWRKKRGRLFRVGMQYSNGASSQLALHDRHEQQIGFGIWFDP